MNISIFLLLALGGQMKLKMKWKMLHFVRDFCVLKARDASYNTTAIENVTPIVQLHVGGHFNFPSYVN